MSYAIAHVVLGYNIPDKVRRFIDDRTGNFEEAGFEELYSANGDTPSYAGIEIGEFDECTDTPAEKLIKKFGYTTDQLTKANEAMQKTKELFVEYLKECEATPEETDELLRALPAVAKVWVIWGSS